MGVFKIAFIILAYRRKLHADKESPNIHASCRNYFCVELLCLHDKTNYHCFIFKYENSNDLETMVPEMMRMHDFSVGVF